jgi:hypothetical protein
MTETEHSLLSFLADLRIALGDNGKRMQPELIEYAKELAKDAARYHKLRDIAVIKGNLEATVAINQLDFIGNNDGFDAAIDSLNGIDESCK